ncbi:phosphonoacetaldehyde reductase [Paenibacillus sp. GYB004]|uniref:phosphonoacetaldehyde reductase n=1 Tax=Paenibacillus sp. GYB004 TaxID=2994393 RepID=UPI002F965C96
MSTFYNPVTVYSGNESVALFLTDLTKRLAPGADRILLLTRGGGVEGSPCLASLYNWLQGYNVTSIEIQIANPDVNDIWELKNRLEGADYQLVIAIGGGSVMDVAKVLSAFQGISLETKDAFREAIIDKTYRRQERYAPWIGIPTTSGTGSEVTSWATVWDEERGVKYSVDDPRLYASAAIILPELAASMPLQLSVSTALDALSHAVEAYWSVRTNPITRLYSLQAIERIMEALPQLKEDPASEKLREQLAYASLYAGLAFSNTRTTACHSISYPLTMLYGIEHGIATSITIGSILSLNKERLIDSHRLLKAFCADCVEDVQQIIFDIYRLYGIPTRLRDYGVTADSTTEIVKRAYTKGRMDNNPIEMTEQDVHDVLQSLL